MNLHTKRDVIHSTRFGTEATANRNRNNINPEILTSFLMRWRHSRCADVILNTLTPFPTRRCHSGTFLWKILKIFCRVIDVLILKLRPLMIQTSMTRKGVYGGPSGPSREGPGVGHKIVSDTKQMTKEKRKK